MIYYYISRIYTNIDMYNSDASYFIFIFFLCEQCVIISINPLFQILILRRAQHQQSANPNALFCATLFFQQYFTARDQNAFILLFIFLLSRKIFAFSVIGKMFRSLTIIVVLRFLGRSKETDDQSRRCIHCEMGIYTSIGHRGAILLGLHSFVARFFRRRTVTITSFSLPLALSIPYVLYNGLLNFS